MQCRLVRPCILVCYKTLHEIALVHVSWPSHDSQRKLEQGVLSLSPTRVVVWCTQLPAAPSDSTLLCIDGEAILIEFSGDEWMALLQTMLAQAPGTDHTHP